MSLRAVLWRSNLLESCGLLRCLRFVFAQRESPRNDIVTNKNLPSTNGTGGKFPWYHPSYTRIACHFVLTNISLSDNVENTVRTTDHAR